MLPSRQTRAKASALIPIYHTCEIYHFLISLGLVISAVFFLSACDSQLISEDRGELLAEVGESRLYFKDLKYIFSTIGPGQDSSILIKSYIESWVRDQAFALEAGRNLSDDPGIERKVETYRNSLVRHEFESRILNERLDTAINQRELVAFYRDNPDQFVSPQLYFRTRLAGFPANHSHVWRLRNQLYDPETKNEAIEDLLDSNDGHWLINPNSWITIGELNSVINNQVSRENIIPGFELTYLNNDYRYFLKVTEVVNEGDILPKEMVENKIRQLIILNRRNQLLAGLRNEVYEREMRNNNVKIYFQ